jgi:hypothetical protein
MCVVKRTTRQTRVIARAAHSHPSAWQNRDASLLARC